MKKLHTASALIELGAAILLLTSPSTMTMLLLGSSLEGVAAFIVARVGGAALLALALACWLARRDATSSASRGLVVAMLIYNLSAVLILATAGLQTQTVGIALWPGVALHVAMFGWCAATIARKI